MLIPSLKLNNLGEKFYLLNKIADRSFHSLKTNIISVTNIADGAKTHIAANLNCFKIYITADKLAARSVQEKLESWGLKVGYIQEEGNVLLNRKTFAGESTIEKISTLNKIINEEIDAVVMSVEAALNYYPNPKLLKEYTLQISTEDVISPQNLLDKLILAGYIRGDVASEPGEVSLRGDILDICNPNGDMYRISFFDELIESIKKIDIDTLKVIEELQTLTIPPISDILLSEETLAKAKKRLETESNSSPIALEMLEKLHVGANDSSTLWALPFIKEDITDIFTFSKYPLVILDEPKMIQDKLDIVRKDFENRLKAFIESGESTKNHFEAILHVEQFRAFLNKCRVLTISSLVSSNTLVSPGTIIKTNSRAVSKYYLDFKQFSIDLKNFERNKFKVILCCGNKEGAKSMIKGLAQDDIKAIYSEDAEGDNAIYATPLKITQGVIYPDLKIALIGFTDCIGKKHENVVKKQKTMFTDPKPGDYVVHRVHGIGICEGTTMMKTGLFEKEYIVLKYKNGDKLYVATDQTDNLQKYVGAEEPKLNKLGGIDFAREKEKVRGSVHKLAIDLLKLYAERENSRGYKYSEDSIWQKEFEDTFEWEETSDQLKAIQDIKKDMERGRLMDRVLVGDVGFGKTEVAFRAMFKTVLEGKQAVLMAPTTILARQHYENIKKRVEVFGIKVALLTRLQTNKENDETIKGISCGQIHMIICTHKGLSNKIDFKDIGLLVLDEEQRFGVEHKETIKNRYPTVNVLTLSATPIPRTLNMALSGLRDISMLETPPRGRLPIQTYIVEYSDAVVKEAILSEFSRGGQTFILLNDISRLEIYAQELREMLGDNVKVITANGQMGPKLIEERMSQFYDKKADVLVCTTIIENGIDIPDANTLVVIESEKFGLSQLYQIRGRVGRRGNLAYAYLTIPSSYMLTADAAKRLQTLMENTEIGSGFQVAMADLSIRGAGTLLGAEQSGHIGSVGYEMYLEMLNDAIEEIRTGVVKKESKPIDMNVALSAYIREGYVAARDKIRIYKQIAMVSSTQQKEELLEELEENYGPVDEPLRNLIDIALIKNMLVPYNVKSVTINKSGAGISFLDTDIFKNETLMETVSRNKENVVLTATIPPTLIFNVKGLNAQESLKKIIDFLNDTITK